MLLVWKLLIDEVKYKQLRKKCHHDLRRENVRITGKVGELGERVHLCHLELDSAANRKTE